ncbi:hypothetical protein [Hymenobacter koreensis]|uniref:Uncharacterized protein n=1 Tax=Hymenobacter koreensis TaxID=1084523 RepID=A0ABP8JHK4_9BACT
MLRFTNRHLGLIIVLFALTLGSCSTDHDTDQISTESPTTRNSTAEQPNSSGYAPDTTAVSQ